MTKTNNPEENQNAALKQLLDAGSGPRFKFRWLWFAAALLIAAGAAFFFYRSSEKKAGPTFKTEPVTVGNLVVKVSATGNLQPTNQVEVGSELSGIIEQVLVDVNDQVTKGQVLARLDISKLQDAVAKSRANLSAAEAKVVEARATAAEARSTLNRYREVARLSGGKVPSKNEMDIAEATLKRAEAAEASARASVTQARANLQSDETDLGKASIRSPIDGVVLSREVDPGQTVAASFQAPVLFLLAEDLKKMELQVDVDEADVGQVKEGQTATFTVDAWPGRRFSAVITRVSFGSQEKDGVISYLTILSVDNEDLSLRPGMTGTAEITTLTRENALLVPNAALRFSPPEAQATQKKSSRGVMSALIPRRPQQPRKASTTPNGAAPRIWVLRDGQPVAVEVKTGATNGRVTEITGGAVEADTEVITETLGG
ncbi:MAG: efflux RND transporter periplasmic adaptor subunit [Deltaproteobacteria bacterium]|nr:efflux RND transporter periplasmic adaptor subunit [Deltaproteobacteria bacterium]